MVETETDDPTVSTEDMHEALQKDLMAIREKYGLDVLMYNACKRLTPVGDELSASKWAFLDEILTADDNEQLIKRWQDTAGEDMSKEELQTAYELHRSLVSLLERAEATVAMIGPGVVTAANLLEEKLGFDKARVHALKLNTAYYVYTEGVQYSVEYNEAFEYAIKIINGPEDATIPPTERVHFMGNVQDSGAVYKPNDMPIVSTGDRMLFSSLDSKEHPCFITDTVKAVAEASQVN